MKAGGTLSRLLLFVLALAAFLPGLATIPPFDRDESRYVQASRQMLETGDFIDIRFQDEARHKKPVGIYWMQAATVHVLTVGGDDGPVWMYRLPSLAGALAAVLLTAWAGASLFGPAAGLLGAAMLATCVILGVEARMAKTDAVQLACVMGCMGVLARVYMRPDLPLPRGLAMLFWLSLGLGILVKGVILMVVGAAMLALWIIDRDAPWLARLRPVAGLAVLLALVLPWLAAITIATDGGFFATAVGHEFLGKAHAGQESHGAPPGYFLASFWISFWPWAPLVLLALPWIWARRHEAAVRFCLAWIIPTWVIHEIVVTKLPHYTLPVLPAVALLAAAALLPATGAVTAPRMRRWSWPAAALMLLVSGALGVVLVGAPYRLMGQGLTGSLVATGGIVLVAGGLLWFLLARHHRGRGLMVALLASLGFHAGLFGMALPGLTPFWLSPQVRQVFDAQKPCAGSILAAGGYTEPSMVFLVGTQTRLGGGGMVAGHLLADPACAIGLVTTGREEAAFLAAMQAAGRHPRRVAELSGFNYSRGRPVLLHFYILSGQDMDR
ncbi:ArnT family glycosyltransferase [Niveispirillum fermenti]|uniref:ArnT family glycosyltransferase n=1 Tax=Niveispirillum fermenti TaxID=1233113 RepID=UPI003A8B113E